jgi:hypothetical protein
VIEDEAATDELVDAGADEVAVIEDEAATDGSSSADASQPTRSR